MLAKDGSKFQSENGPKQGKCDAPININCKANHERTKRYYKKKNKDKTKSCCVKYQCLNSNEVKTSTKSNKSTEPTCKFVCTITRAKNKDKIYSRDFCNPDEYSSYELSKPNSKNNKGLTGVWQRGGCQPEKIPKKIYDEMEEECYSKTYPDARRYLCMKHPPCPSK